MKNYLAALTLLAVSSPLTYAQCVSGLGATPYQLGSGDWSPASSLSADQTFRPYQVGPGSQLASDGNQAWLLNSSDQTIYRVFYDTTSPLSLGINLMATQTDFLFVRIQFLGGHLYGIGTGGQLRAMLPGNTFSDGFMTGTQVTGMAFDGQYIWVATPGTLYVVTPSTKASPTPALHAKYTLPRNIVAGQLLFDGANVWMNGGGLLTEIDPATGALKIGVFSGVQGPALFDGAFLWFASAGAVTKFDTGTGAATNYTPNVAAAGILGFDGTGLWVQGTGYAGVGRVRACDGARNTSITLPDVPTAVTLAGGFRWIIYQKGGVISIR